MAFNVNRIKFNTAAFGYAKRNKFEVFVQTPQMFRGGTLNINGFESNLNSLNNMMRYRIEQVKAPGASLLSSDVRRYGIGTTQKMPYSAQFSDTTLTIVVDRRTALWDFWYNWVNTIYNFNGQEPNGNNINAGSRTPTYTTRYKEDYATTIMIVIYDDFGNRVKTINLYDAFPSSVGETNLNWGDSQNLLRLSVSITYSTYTIEGSSILDNNLLLSPILNPLSLATLGASVITTI